MISSTEAYNSVSSLKLLLFTLSTHFFHCIDGERFGPFPKFVNNLIQAGCLNFSRFILIKFGLTLCFDKAKQVFIISLSLLLILSLSRKINHIDLVFMLYTAIEFVCGIGASKKSQRVVIIGKKKLNLKMNNRLNHINQFKWCFELGRRLCASAREFACVCVRTFTQMT